jgi:hypothetical protein
MENSLGRVAYSRGYPSNHWNSVDSEKVMLDAKGHVELHVDTRRYSIIFTLARNPNCTSRNLERSPLSSTQVPPGSNRLDSQSERSSKNV